MKNTGKFTDITFWLIVLGLALLCQAHSQEYLSPIQAITKKCKNYAIMVEESVPLDACSKKVADFAISKFSNQTALNLLFYAKNGVYDLGKFYLSSDDKDSYKLRISARIKNIVTLQFEMLLPYFCPMQMIEPAKPFLAKYLGKLFDIKMSIRDFDFVDVGTTNNRLMQIRPGLFIYLGVTLVILAFYLTSLCIRDIEGMKNTILRNLFRCFNLKKSVMSILCITEGRGDSNLAVLNGIRVLMSCWVVIGHSFYLPIYEPFYNPTTILDDAFNRYFMAFIKGGTLSVDVFLFLSGFFAGLMSYSVFKKDENRSIWGFLNLVLHRYIRLTPVFAFTIVCTIFIQPIAYQNGMHNSVQGQILACEQQWHLSLLYINNFFTSVGDYCNGWVWYLFIDMQLFIITSIIIALYLKYGKYIIIPIISLCLISLTYQLWISILYKFDLTVVKFSYSFANLPSESDQRTIYYCNPYCRFIPYFIGLLLIIKYCDYKAMKSEKKNSNLLGFYGILGFLMMFSMVFSFYFIDHYQEKVSVLIGACHMVFCRIVFSLGLAMFLYYMLFREENNPSFAANILGNKITAPLAKLSYGMYMMHMPINAIVISVFGKKDYYSVETILIKAGITIVVSYFAAFIVTFLYENPCVTCLKIIQESKKSAKKDK